MTWDKLTPAERGRWLVRADRALEDALALNLSCPNLAYVSEDTARLTSWTPDGGTVDHGIVTLPENEETSNAEKKATG